jgi:tight adherence protein B
VSGLAAALIGLAALFGERAMRDARRTAVLQRVAPRPPVRDRSTWRPPGWLVWGIGGSAVGAAFGSVTPAMACGGLATGVWFLRRRRARKALAARRDEQLADAVGALGSALRAGLSLPQSLAYAAGEAEAPLDRDLKALVRDLDLGVPLDDAVTSWAEAHGGEDARLLAGVMSLHRRSGGDLPAVLDQVSATLRERVAVTREVSALTAQARLSGAILGALPIGFFGFLWLTARRDIAGAMGATAGRFAVGLGLVLEGAAFVWIRKLLAVQR